MKVTPGGKPIKEILFQKNTQLVLNTQMVHYFNLHKIIKKEFSISDMWQALTSVGSNAS